MNFDKQFFKTDESGKPIARFDILPALKDGDFHDWTLMPERENVLCGVDVAIMSDTALTTSPFSYSKACDTFRPRIWQ